MPPIVRFAELHPLYKATGYNQKKKSPETRRRSAKAAIATVPAQGARTGPVHVAVIIYVALSAPEMG